MSRLTIAGWMQGVEDDGNQVLLEDGEPYLDMDSLTYLHVLSVDEVCKVLERVRANDVKVLPVQDRCEWADNLIIASAHSTRHLRGIADSIVYEVKSKPESPTICWQFSIVILNNLKLLASGC